MSRTERLAQPEQFGKYHLIARLAHGRMGDVYKAKSHGVEGFERILVVKTIHAGLAAVPGFLDVVVEEAQRAVILSHANVAQVLNLGQEDAQNRAFLATEYVNGLDLQRAMSIAAQSQTPWPFELSVFIAAEIAKGLDYAHSRKDYNFNLLNLMHRDLGPYNIMFSTDGDVKITDFGISRAMGLIPPQDDNERIRRVLYQAPESARGEQYTQQSDLFSLGLVLYEMLAGRHPYLLEGADANRVEQLARAGQVVPLSHFFNAPRPLAQVIDAMLTPDPAGRVAKAHQVYEELIGFIYGNNLQRADAIALGSFVQELRKDEHNYYPDQNNQEVGFDEISLSELQVPESAQSLFGDMNNQAPPPAPPPMPQPSIPAEISEATADALPRQKIQQLIMGEKREQKQESSGLPGALDEFFNKTRAGRGKAVLVYGNMGAGSDYLPDRLVDILSLRGNTMCCAVQCTVDDKYRPFGTLFETLRQAMGKANKNQDATPQDTVEYARQIGLSEDALRALSGTLGRQNECLRSTPEHKRKLLTHVCAMIIQHLCKHNTLVFVFDHAERMDNLSLEILRNLIGTIGSLPAMVIMATMNVEQMREVLDAGNPEHLGAVKVVGRALPKLSDLGRLSDDANRALALLAVTQNRMRQDELAILLGWPSDRLFAAMKELVEIGIVRVPTTGVFLVAISHMDAWLDDTFGPKHRRELASTLLRHYGKVRERVSAPMLLRLEAIAQERRQFIAEADRYTDWLHREGWLHDLLAFHQHATSLMMNEALGAPKARLDHMMSGAELALELAMPDACRSTVGPVAALSETIRDERGAIRSHLLQGQLAMLGDDLDEARQHFGRAVEAAHALHDPDLLARAMVALSGWYERYGDTLAAQRTIEGALNLYKRWGTRRMDMHSRALLLNRAVNMWCARGMFGRARELITDLNRIAQLSGLASLDCRVDWARARIAIASGDKQQATKLLEQAAETARQHGLTTLYLELMRQQCSFEIESGDFESASQRLQFLIPLSQRYGDIYSHQRALDMQAFTHCMLSRQIESALMQLDSSLERANTRKVPKDQYRCNAYLDRAYTKHNRESEALPHRQAARQIAGAMRYTHVAA